MKLLFTLFLLSVFNLSAVAQTVTYDIPIGQTIGLQQTSGDICSAPFTVEEAFQASLGNTWGFTWTSTNAGTAISVDVELGFTIADGGGTFPTTLNGISSFNVSDGTTKNCETSTLMTWSVDPSNYISGGSNTFLVDFALAPVISQVDNLPYAGDPFFRVTVEYIPCPAIDTSVTQSFNTLMANASNATFHWIDCETGDTIPGATNSLFTPSISGTYGVIVTDTATGCSDTSACRVIDLGTNVKEYDQIQMQLFPNPVTDVLWIDAQDKDGSVVLFVYDLQGREVYREKVVISLGNQLTVDLTNLKPGSYNVFLTSKGWSSASMLIKL